MAIVSTTLSNNTEINVLGLESVGIQYKAIPGGRPIIEGSVNTTGSDWVRIRGTKRSSLTLDNGEFVLDEIIDYPTRHLARIRIVNLTGTVAVDYHTVPFEFARQPQDYATLGGLGDSQLVSGITTVAGVDQQDLVTGRLGAMTGHNVLMWASGYSIGRLVYAGIEGNTGLTSQQILDQFLPGALRHGWTFCAISATTNDIGASVPAATTINNIEFMVQSLLSVGTIPIIMGNLPNRLTTGAAYDDLNIGLRNLANKYANYGVIFEDAWAPYVGTDGLGLVGSFRDNVHLTFSANRIRGQNIAALILGSHPWVRDAYRPVSNAAGKRGLAANPIFTANSGAVTPTGWTLTGTGATTNVAAGTVGNDWTSTRGPANMAGNTTANIAVKGATYVWVSRVGTTNVINASSEIGFRDPAFVNANHAWRWVINDQELPTSNFVLAVKFSVPSASVDQYYRFQSAGASGSTFIHSQFELYPTTAWV